MANREANIDIVFRNGLKNLEVLPPNDIWGNIQPFVKRKQKSIYLIRAAASVAVLISIGIISYWLTTRLSGNFSRLAVSMNQDVKPEGIYAADKKHLAIANKENPESRVKTADAIKDETDYSDMSNYQRLAEISLRNQVISENIIPGINENNTQLGSLIKNSNSVKGLNIFKLSGKYTPVKPENTGSRWSISAMGSPTYYSGNSIMANAALDNMVKSEQPLVSYSGGVAVSYSLNNRISIQSGIYYSSVGQKVTDINAYTGFAPFVTTKGSSDFKIETSRGTIISTNNNLYFNDGVSNRVMTAYTSDVFDPNKLNLQYLSNSIRQNFNYIEVPLIVRYKIIDKKIDLNLIGGISYNLLVGNSAYTSANGTSDYIGKTLGLSPLTLSSSLGMGMEYNLSKKISFNLEPTFRYYISPFGELNGNELHPYSIGLFSGFSYKF